MSQLCMCVAKLSAEQRQALLRWLSELPADQFGARNVRPLQRHISGLARRQVAHNDFLFSHLCFLKYSSVGPFDIFFPIYVNGTDRGMFYVPEDLTCSACHVVQCQGSTLLICASNGSGNLYSISRCTGRNTVEEVLPLNKPLRC